MLLMTGPSPAAEAAVRATQCRASGRSAAQSLDGRWSGGYSRHPMPDAVFSTRSRAATAAFNTEGPPKIVFPLSCLIPLTFTHSNL